jgi:hydrogenase-4 membrane subunit HyfE
MSNEPKKLVTRVLEFAVAVALSGFLIRLGVGFILDVWWIFLILAAVIVGGVVVYRLWRNRPKW